MKSERQSTVNLLNKHKPLVADGVSWSLVTQAKCIQL